MMKMDPYYLEIWSEWFPKACLALAAFLFFSLLASIVRRSINRVGQSLDDHKQPIIHLMSYVAYISLMIVALITALGSLGVNVNALVASLGLSGLGISLALKDILSNILAGILVLLYQPFTFGQQIEVDGSIGTVSNINLRYTELSCEGRKVLIPNSTLLVKSVHILDS